MLAAVQCSDRYKIRRSDRINLRELKIVVDEAFELSQCEARRTRNGSTGP